MRVIVTCAFCSKKMYLNLKIYKFVVKIRKLIDDNDININDKHLNIKINIKQSTPTHKNLIVISNYNTYDCLDLCKIPILIVPLHLSASFVVKIY